MFRVLLVLLLSALVKSSVIGTSSAGGSTQHIWGNIETRPGAFLFYWTYVTENFGSKPLILWLQGGPGLSSTGIGNFMEIGPNDVFNNSRPYAWTNDANVLFVDSPVTTGFSYVLNNTVLPKTNTEMVTDLYNLLYHFYQDVPKLQTSPLYIFGENYGGKVAAELAYVVSQKIKQKKLPCVLAGVGLGGAWISPIDSTEAFGRFLYSNSLIDSEGFTPIGALADNIKALKASGANRKATKLWHSLVKTIEKQTNGVNFMNILEQNHILTQRATSRPSYITNSYNATELEALTKLMNGRIRKKLALPGNHTWAPFSDISYNSLFDDFLSPASSFVEKILNETSIPVMVYNGQMDLLVPSVGVENWIKNMKWPGVAKWCKSARLPIILKSSKQTVGFRKSFKNLSMRWLLKAGNTIPRDIAEVAYYMMKDFTGIKY